MAEWNRRGKVGWSRGIRHWTLGRTLYLSVPFTWLVADAERMAREHKGPVIAGGPGVKLLHPEPDSCDWAATPDSVPFDTLAMHNPLAGRSTVGCPNNCAFCAVPSLEGPFRELPEDEWRISPVRWDSNLLAASEGHIQRLVNRLVEADFPSVDFNQGLDARRFTDFHAQAFAAIRGVIVRFAWDSEWGFTVLRAVERAEKAGIAKRRIRVYVLVGFDESPEEAMYRLEQVRWWGVKPNPMRYQPLDATVRNAYVPDGWTPGLLQDVCRYYARDIFRRIPFKEFHGARQAERRDAERGSRQVQTMLSVERSGK